MFSFFKQNREPFALEISDSSIKVATIKRKKREVVLSWVIKEEIEEGIIENGEIKKEKNFKELLQKFIKEKWKERIKTNYVLFSLPEQKIFSKILKLPKLPEKEIKNILLFEAEKNFPLPLEKIYLDHLIISPVFDNLDYVEVLMVGVQKSVVDTYLNLMKEIDIFPVCFEPESMAISRALIEKEITTEPVLILDLGAKNTKFIIFAGTSIRFSSTLPIGSFHFTEAIAKNLNLSFQEAERLKVEKGLGEKLNLKLEEGGKKIRKKRDDIFECLIPTLVDLVQQIRKYLDYYQFHANHFYLTANKKPISKIILSGGGAQLKGIEQFLMAELGYKIEKGNPLSNVSIDPEIKNTEENFLPFVTVVGLALRINKEKFYD